MNQPQQIRDAICAAKRPAVLFDSSLQPHVEALLRLCEAADLPLLASTDAFGVLPFDHRLNAGHCSFASAALARRVAAATDLLLVLGNKPSEFAFSAFDSRRDLAWIHCAERDAELLSGPRTLHTVVSPLAQTLQGLTTMPWGGSQRSGWFRVLKQELELTPVAEKPAQGFGIDPRAAVRVIGATLPESSWVCIDIGAVAAFCLEGLVLPAGARAYAPIERSACMAHPLGASLGIALATRAPTVALVGDGAFKMLAEELHTAAQVTGDLPWVVVVFENGGYGMVRAGAEQYGPDHGLPCGHWVKAPDLVSVARGWGVHAVAVESEAALQSALQQAFASARPSVIVAHVDRTVAPPIGERVKQLSGED